MFQFKWGIRINGRFRETSQIVSDFVKCLTTCKCFKDVII